MKGIVLAGGLGTRLYPATKIISKQLIPIYDKPMIYYPISTLMLAEIKDILIISTQNDIPHFKNLLGDGKEWGLNFQYIIQKKPEGLAQAFVIGEEFIENEDCVLILGDNIFYGDSLKQQLINSKNRLNGATIFAYPVNDPQRYGVIDFDKFGKALSIEEKPLAPKTNFAVTGIYFYNNEVVKKAKSLTPSKRGEFEITDLNNLYLSENRLNVEIFGRGMAWLDTGTFDSLVEASQFVQTIEKRQGLKICCPEEIAWDNRWIDNKKLLSLAEKNRNNAYGLYLKKIIGK